MILEPKMRRGAYLEPYREWTVQTICLGSHNTIQDVLFQVC